jgi:histidine triad (HIT) family protein
MEECIFCKIAQGGMEARKVREDEDLVAFEDVAPRAPTHLLVIPRRHVGSLDEAGDEHAALLGRLLLACRDLARERGLTGEGYRVVTNCGPGAGQSVLHLHLHLLGGRRFTWPPG